MTNDKFQNNSTPTVKYETTFMSTMLAKHTFTMRNATACENLPNNNLLTAMTKQNYGKRKSEDSLQGCNIIYDYNFVIFVLVLLLLVGGRDDCLKMKTSREIL